MIKLIYLGAFFYCVSSTQTQNIDYESNSVTDILDLGITTYSGGKSLILSNHTIPCFKIKPKDSIECYFYNHKLVSIAKVENNELNGVYIFYGQTKEIEWIGHYLNGIAHGVFLDYKNDKPIKLTVYFFGKIFFKSPYTQNSPYCNPLG